MYNFQPVIKWSGSKRTQSAEIIKFFPKKIKTYYEPFCGGCSMMRRLMEDEDIQVERFVVSDSNKGLMDLWQAILERPLDVANYYDKLWHEMNASADKAEHRSFFEEVRARYNKEHNPLDFMFIMRTTTNGMPRYNSNGDFNNSYHITRDGIHPDKLRKIIYEWSNILSERDVEFRCCSYEDIHPQEGDFLYLDPPYAHTKGMYSGKFDNTKLFDWISKLPCKYILSYDGKSGDDDRTYDVPEELYDVHTYIHSGNSSFKRVIGKSRDSIVYESLYVKMFKDYTDENLISLAATDMETGNHLLRERTVEQKMMVAILERTVSKVEDGKELNEKEKELYQIYRKMIEPAPVDEDIRTYIENFYSENKNGLAYMTVCGLWTSPIDKFCMQNVDGMLYDLNRLEESSLTLNDDHMVNDIAVAKVIRYLKSRVDYLENKLKEVQ